MKSIKIWLEAFDGCTRRIKLCNVPETVRAEILQDVKTVGAGYRVYLDAYHVLVH